MISGFNHLSITGNLIANEEVAGEYMVVMNKDIEDRLSAIDDNNKPLYFNFVNNSDVSALVSISCMLNKAIIKHDDSGYVIIVYQGSVVFGNSIIGVGIAIIDTAELSLRQISIIFSDTV